MISNSLHGYLIKTPLKHKRLFCEVREKAKEDRARKICKVFQYLKERIKLDAGRGFLSSEIFALSL